MRARPGFECRPAHWASAQPAGAASAGSVRILPPGSERGRAGRADAAAAAASAHRGAGGGSWGGRAERRRGGAAERGGAPGERRGSGAPYLPPPGCCLHTEASRLPDRQVPGLLPPEPPPRCRLPVTNSPASAPAAQGVRRARGRGSDRAVRPRAGDSRTAGQPRPGGRARRGPPPHRRGPPAGRRGGCARVVSGRARPLQTRVPIAAPTDLERQRRNRAAHADAHHHYPRRPAFRA
jgi:hypothetical protein